MTQDKTKLIARLGLEGLLTIDVAANNNKGKIAWKIGKGNYFHSGFAAQENNTYIIYASSINQLHKLNAENVFVKDTTYQHNITVTVYDNMTSTLKHLLFQIQWEI
ncbi:hypothetical protein ABK040_012578 [Willaertia magna]